MIKYVGEKLGAKMTFDIVSVSDDFGQGPLRHGLLWRVVKTTNNPSLLKTSPTKREAIGQFIQDNKVNSCHLWWFPTSWSILHPG